MSTSVVPVEKLDRLSKHNNHQGAVARISPVDFYDLEQLIEETLEAFSAIRERLEGGIYKRMSAAVAEAMGE